MKMPLSTAFQSLNLAEHKLIRQDLETHAGPSENLELPGIAHQRHRFAVHPPLICRHLVIFFPYNKGEKFGLNTRPGDFVKGRIAAAEAVKTICGLIVDRIPDPIRNSSEGPPADELRSKMSNVRDRLKLHIERGVVNNGSVRFRAGILNDFALRVKADIYAEFLSVTFFLDEPQYTDEEAAPANQTVESIIAHWEPWVKSVLKEAADVYDRMEILHAGIWQAFDAMFELSEIWGCTKVYDARYPTMGLIGDFRGAVFSSGFGLPSASGLDSQSHPYPGIRLWKTSFPSREPRAYFQDKSNYKLFLDFLGFNQDGTSIDPVLEARRAEANIVLCNMLNGNALYGSTLGSLINNRPKITNDYLEVSQFFEKGSLPEHSVETTGATTLPAPVNYFVIYNGQSSHQLGRLIHRLHVLGELRMAALLDHKTIFYLNGAIGRLGQEVANALASPDKIRRQVVRSIVRTYSAIGNRCHGGLAFRSRRCKDYLEVLQFHSEHTGTTAIDGWQSYVVFIERNLRREFQSIISIGSRYEELGVRVDRVISVYQAEKSMKMANRSLFVAIITLVGIYMSQAVSEVLSAEHQNRGIITLVGTVLAGILAVLLLDRSQKASRSDSESDSDNSEL